MKRFWDKVSVGEPDDCWLWTAYKDAGYGIFATSADGFRKNYKAHVFSYLLTYGHVPEGKCVCHSCDNPSCVNPLHLFLGSHVDNMRDKKHKGRAYRHPRKLTAADADVIRQLCTKGFAQHLVALWFGTTRQNVGKIVNYKTFRRCK